MRPSASKDPIHQEFWLSISLIGIITLLLLVTTVVMMALGGVFLPFGFDSDLLAKVFSPPLLISVAIIIVLLVSVMIVYSLVRRRHLAS